VPDITMCISQTCPIRDMCYRHKAVPDKYQSYANFSELVVKDNSNFCHCTEWIPIYEEMRRDNGKTNR
jgi:hypothetical protein